MQHSLEVDPKTGVRHRGFSADNRDDVRVVVHQHVRHSPALGTYNYMPPQVEIVAPRLDYRGAEELTAMMLLAVDQASTWHADTDRTPLKPSLAVT